MNMLARFTSWKNMNRLSYFLYQKNMGLSTSADKLVDVQVNSDTGYAVVTMQRAPVNGLNLELLTELLSTFSDLEKNKCRGMIFTSAFPTVFSAGLDITEMYKPQPDRLKKFWTSLQDTWLYLYSSSYPTAAVITGHSPAGGCLLACSCEYRIMLKGKYSIGLNETQLGIVAPTWFIDSFKAVVASRHTEMALTTGTLFPVDEALKIGLIDEIANDKNEAMEKAENFLKKFKRISPTARGNTKLSLRYDAIKRLQDSREQDLLSFVKFITSPEVQKGLELYMQELKKAKS